MTKQFSLLELFSLVDGRLSTGMDDIYSMLNHLCDTELSTMFLPKALEYVKKKNPVWIKQVEKRLTNIKEKCQSNTFETVIGYIKDNANDIYDIPQLKDEFDTSDFHSFMFTN